MATDERVAAWLADIGSVLEARAFVTKHRDFIHKHCDKFSDDDENKLEYTEIFEEYVGFVEEAIEGGMKDKSGDFSMEQLMEALPDYVEKAGKADDVTQQAQEGAAKAIDLLLGLAEFQSLKATMLLAQRDKAEGKDGNSGALFAVSVEDGAAGTDLGGLITASGDHFERNEGWSRLCDRSWLVIERKEVKINGKDHSLMKSTVTLDLPITQARTVILDFTERRRGWDDRFNGVVLHKRFPGRGINQIITLKQKMPYMFKMMGVPDSFTVRMIERIDFPFKGDFYHITAPWDLQKDTIDANNKWLEAKAGVLRAHPTDPNKTIFIGTSTNKLNWVPDWVVSALMTTMMPKMILSLVDKFKQHVKAHPTFEELPMEFEG
uniref:ADP-ribosylation factor-like protein 2-binding protein n=1 Tax=Hemiselmis tepida TaxID=464990 RepID=A0A7S0V2Q6_9CRYP|mmetsp:Transcript_11786/g.30598  ORF Transcript_11786/g.30598 Transcript_11786/m.30598 type:complete len:378 (+) Transcript_11786:127-1260(+)|eukprot:CAMPEP_0174928392 /NCGR_PEP_ID=MMETSP1355-20121228/23113_1 /TAXON_ID=464990 /ORGANISM="Hemiselmis tepida, Strain CCMP443" /LENGTH=377 /DNA_ID=CAMNT_0016174549 /DNA_START=118 /DNA_END=1251 /DNA_ORIENTATION=+